MNQAKLSGTLSKIADTRRIAFVPEVVDGNGDSHASRFSGRAWLRSGESWPVCSNCNKPLQLFLQLNLGNLASNGGYPLHEGYVQMFYCTSSAPLCEVDCEAYFPFSKSTLLRVIPADEAVVDTSAPDGAFPAKAIDGWKSVDDYPSWDELEELGVELSDDEFEALAEEYPLRGEKLFGWPMWIQGPEYPTCPECQTPMNLLFQIDSDESLPDMFGDSGCGHITYCSKHPTVLTFGWACC